MATPVTTRVDRAPVRRWRPPLLWRVLLAVAARPLVFPLCRLRVTGDVPDAMRDGPLILAANHVGSFDPFILAAACASRRIAPRIMATGGLFRAPVVGPLMRAAGHLRVDRRTPTVTEALGTAEAALAASSVLLAYPEGRITLDPGMWPERGKTGLARLAVATGVPVVPVAQWGAHLVLPWGAPRRSLGRLLWAMTHRPVIRVHFGTPIDVSGTGQGARAIRETTDRIMDAITDDLRPLRATEPRLPGWVDPARPVTTGRRHRHRAIPAGGVAVRASGETPG
jgi:1-acyl-sn-glycerol-3-phosphate acyltransferase